MKTTENISFGKGYILLIKQFPKDRNSSVEEIENP
jgi:hypothetical protein